MQVVEESPESTGEEADTSSNAYTPTRVQEDKRLKWIAVKTDNRLVRKYKLDYDQGAVTRQSRLTIINRIPA
ncbi:MAG: hypothetical protein JXB88_01310 [Spirochaetales bacterium]|nr:hypothetical protein [Spirochaetales bacterium]